jgi:hypothetical protein
MPLLIINRHGTGRSDLTFYAILSSYPHNYIAHISGEVAIISTLGCVRPLRPTPLRFHL